MNYFTINNIRLSNPATKRNVTFVKAVGKELYGFKMFFNDDYLGINWVSSNKNEAHAKAKTYVFGPMSPDTVYQIYFPTAVAQ